MQEADNDYVEEDMNANVMEVDKKIFQFLVEVNCVLGYKITEYHYSSVVTQYGSTCGNITDQNILPFPFSSLA